VVNPSNGHILVADSGVGRVYDFSSATDETPVVWDGSGTPAGSFGEGPVAVAVDNATGDVYVSDATHLVVDKFDPAGNLISSFGDNVNVVTKAPEPNGQLAGLATPAKSFSHSPVGSEPVGIAVDQATHDLYVIDSGTEHEVIDVFDSTGAFIPAKQITAHPLGLYGCSGAYTTGIAVSAKTGHVFVSDSCPEEVFEFDQLGLPVGEPWNGSPAVNPPGTPAERFSGYLSVAVNDSSENVYVSESFTKAVDAFSAAGEFLAPQLAGTPGGQDGAVAVDPGSSDLLVSDNESHAVTVFGGSPVLLPGVTTAPATNVAPRAATLNGAVDPEGVEVTGCRFEYVAAAEYRPLAFNPYKAGDTVPCAETVGSGSGQLAVHADASSLEPGTTYHFRLEASNANGAEFGEDATFSTPPPPTISGESASNLTKETADLSATVNPGGIPVQACTFEYGTEAGVYPRKLECNPPPAQLGSGTTPVTIAQQLTGLEHDHAYHWRITATNAAGTAASPDHTFIYTTTEAGGLPDNRAYEMVTPPAKNAADIGNVFVGLLPGIAADGSRVTLAAVQCFGDAGSCPANRGPAGTGYAFSREPGGWVANALAPPVTQFPASTVVAANPDTGAALISAPTPPHGQDDWYVRQLDGTMTDIGPVTPPELGGEQGPGKRAFATADFSHVIAAEASNGWPFETGLLEWAGSGLSQPEPVGASGGRFCAASLGARAENPSSSSALSADGETVFFRASDGCVEPGSQGRSVTAQYAWLKRSETVRLSASQCGEGAGQNEVQCRAAPPAMAMFEGAAVDGSKAFFTSRQQLTDNASEDSDPRDQQAEETAGGFECTEAVGVNGCNLYEYDFTKPVGQRLVAVSAGDTSGKGPRVQGAVAISDDGSHVYFVARGVLSSTPNSAEATAKAGAPNLYLFERDAAHPAGVTTFIATLSDSSRARGADANLWRNGDEWANVSSDGRFLVFASTAPLTRDDTRPEGGGAQVFRFDAATDALLRVSIGEGGFNDNGNAGVGNAQIAAGGLLVLSVGSSGRRDPTMSDNGQRIFFDSPVGLTPHALNDVVIGEEGSGELGLAQNVFEWEQAGTGSCPADHGAGCVSLISDGRDVSTSNSLECGGELSSVCLVGTDLTGSNVFFMSADQLVPGDTDTQLDVYDARICEPERGNPCVSAAPKPLPPCLGEACHGTPPATPGAPNVPSATFNGSGNTIGCSSSSSAPPSPAGCATTGGGGKPSCSSTSGAPSRSCTKKQNLAKALATCRRRYPHSRKKRAGCEAAARHTYAAKAAAHNSTAARHRR
jgi:DNA-binding beta-propeller fold protein YncE